MNRRGSRKVWIAHVPVGGDAPIMVQSMTNTDTADAAATAQQVLELARAGSEVVRITVNTAEAAAAVPAIRAQLDAWGCNVPLVGDFHFNGHKLLAEFPDCATALAKYRINPGNVGRGAKRDEQFATMVETACRHAKAGADRRQLGQPRPGAARAPDGRERRAGPAAGSRRGHARGADRFGGRERSARGGDRPAG